MRFLTGLLGVVFVVLGVGRAGAAEAAAAAQLDETTQRNYRFAIQQAHEELELVREMLKVVGVEAEALKKLDDQLVKAVAAIKVVREEIDAGKKPTTSLEAAKQERGAYEKMLAEVLPKEKAVALVRKLQSPQVQGSRFTKALRHNLDSLNLAGAERSKANFIADDLEKQFRGMADEFPTEQEQLLKVRSEFQGALHSAGDRLADVLGKEQTEQLRKAMPAMFRAGK